MSFFGLKSNNILLAMNVINPIANTDTCTTITRTHVISFAPRLAALEMVFFN